jgi:hypothetical protein
MSSPTETTKTPQYKAHDFVVIDCLFKSDSETMFGGFFPSAYLFNLRTSRSDGPEGQARRPLPILAKKWIRS